MKGGIELQGESFSDQIFLKYYGILKKIQEGDVDREMKNRGGSYEFFFPLRQSIEDVGVGMEVGGGVSGELPNYFWRGGLGQVEIKFLEGEIGQEEGKGWGENIFERGELGRQKIFFSYFPDQGCGKPLCGRGVITCTHIIYVVQFLLDIQ